LANQDAFSIEFDCHGEESGDNRGTDVPMGRVGEKLQPTRIGRIPLRHSLVRVCWAIPILALFFADSQHSRAQTPDDNNTQEHQFGPTFECKHYLNPIAALICKSRDLSLRQVQFMQARQALLQQIGGAQHCPEQTRPCSEDEMSSELIDEDMEKFFALVSAKCEIPADGDAPELTPNRLNCLKEEYQKQRSAWMAQLLPPAHEEASRTIRVHFALQKALQTLGFLKDSDRIDGMYGPKTRSAIIQWEKAQQLPLTGFLDDLPIQLAQAAQPPREAAGLGWRRRAGCRS
jgi:hypothetical protein